MTDRAEQALASIEIQAVQHVMELLSERLKTDDTVWSIMEQVIDRGPDHPLVAPYVALFVQVECNKAAKGYFASMIRRKRDEEARPSLTGADDKLMSFIDEGFVGAGWRPSEMYLIGFNMTTLPATWRTWAFEASRERYREGFYADPFTNNPQRREAA